MILTEEFQFDRGQREEKQIRETENLRSLDLLKYCLDRDVTSMTGSFTLM